ncbi:hypothetical protein FS837_011475 [Tulasnella sp. UAMH 9824]|nr:hypothetical protein FS837_011475 [Tulasnella sp. UAMH 9824]
MDSKSAQFSEFSYYPDSEPQTAVSSTFQEKIALGPSRVWITRPARPRWSGLIPAAAVIITTIGFVAAILGVLFGKQCHETQGGSGIRPVIRAGIFYTSENHEQSPDSQNHLWVLTISGLASQFISVTSSIIMALVAYRVGAEWLRLSRRPSDSSIPETPSPAQYGLLVRLLGTSSIGPIVEGLIYTAQSWKRARLPRMVRFSLWLAVAVWVLARLVGLTDVWLHTSSFSRRSNVTLPHTESSPSPSTMWGVAFNDSICEDMRTKHTDAAPLLSGNLECQAAYETFVFWEDWGHATAFDTITNSTDASFLVGSVDGETAFVLPGPQIVDMVSKNFLIPTFATRANCTSINYLCTTNANGIIDDCAPAGYPTLPLFRNATGTPQPGMVPNRILGKVGQDIVGIQGGSFESLLVPLGNKARIYVQLQWERLEQGVWDATRAKPILSVEDHLAIDHSPEPTLYADCELSFFNAFVQWNSTKHDWKLLNTTDLPQEQTAALWLPLVWQYATERLAASLMYTARTDTKEVVMQALGQNLASLTLAAAAGFYKPGNGYNVTETRKLLVSAYPALPIMVLLSLLCAYAALATGVFISVCCVRDEVIIFPPADHGFQEEHLETSTMTLAMRWLTNPLPLVGVLFAAEDGRDGARSAAYSPMNAAYDGDEEHTRLAIGLDGDRFGVTPWSQR